jgi:outer membrane protein
VKNALIIWNALLTIAVGYLWYNNCTNCEAPTTKGGVAKTADGKSIVYVNTDSLLSKYEYFKDTQKELENKQYRLQADLAQKGKALENEAVAAERKAPTMTQAELQATQLRLQKIQSDLVAYRDNQSAALAQESAKKNEELINSIQTYLKKHNDQSKYQFVLGYSKGGGILFADDKLEITQQILDGLNKEYKDKKGSAEEKKTSGK